MLTALGVYYRNGKFVGCGLEDFLTLTLKKILESVKPLRAKIVAQLFQIGCHNINSLREYDNIKQCKSQ
jgi:hypothetical protein